MGRIPSISRKEERTPCLLEELDGFILFIFRGLELTGPTYAALGSRLRSLEQTYHSEHRGKHIGSAAVHRDCWYVCFSEPNVVLMDLNMVDVSVIDVPQNVRTTHALLVIGPRAVLSVSASAHRECCLWSPLGDLQGADFIYLINFYFFLLPIVHFWYLTICLEAWKT